MCLNVVKYLFFIIFLKLALCLTGGERYQRPYMVYIVWNMDKSRGDEMERDTRALCGGSLLTPSYAVTSASCLQVKDTLYMVAGYNKYVPNASKKYNDTCINSGISRRRIVLKCISVHRQYFDRNNISHYELRSWEFMSEGLAKTERPYDFNDTSFLKYCSYIPSKISIYQGADVPFETDALVLGWGSTKYHRPEGYRYDMNQEYLMGITTRVINRDTCWLMHNITQSGRICTLGKGETSLKSWRRGINKLSNETMDFLAIDERGSQFAKELFDVDPSARRKKKDKKIFVYDDTLIVYKHGLCQNDHGGPLIVKVNGTEYLAGIAAGYFVDDMLECTGPYWFRQPYRRRVQCVIRADPYYRRTEEPCDNEDCDKLENKMIHVTVNWDKSEEEYDTLNQNANEDDDNY
ncbi:uncharacterized protein LOC142985184 isoform X2 [Anticarsia gemmatalis]|uniref:uncharacterized protein LOC142985184 isoform X2 n=1 Tax=Anticarsia gemmatalis TaxID=129554 RepID=UPI003F76AA24